MTSLNLPCREMLAQLPDVLFRYRFLPEPAFEYVNEAITRMTGYTPADCYADPLMADRLVHPDDRARIAEGVQNAHNGNPVPPQTMRWVSKDGRVIWTEQRNVAVLDGEGRLVAIEGVVRDVTERVATAEALRASEQTLREREAQYRTMIEHGTDVVATLTRDGIITYESPSAETVFGYRPDEVVGTHGFARVHPDDLERVAAIFSGAILNGTAGRAEYRYRHKNGEWVHVESYGRPLVDGHGSVVAAVVSTRDITERRRAEKALEEAHAFRQAVEDSLRAGLIAHDREGRVSYVNRGFVEMFGWTAEELIGRVAPFPYWAPETVDEIWPKFNRVAIEGEPPPAPVQARYMRKSGDRVDVEILVSPLATSRGPMTLAAMYDVTERKLLEAEFRQAQKLEAIGRLAGGVAHDFNNILTAILGYAEMAIEDTPPEHPLRADLEEIKRAGDRAAALTRQLLAFSRQQIVQPEIIDLNIVVDELMKMLRRLIGEDVRLTTSFAPGRQAIKADRGQIEQLLMNLAVNARDAMPSGGSLLIQTGTVHVGVGRRTIGGDVPPGEYVALAVSDTGCGMSSDTASHLFEPFFTTKEKGKGTGLGLATVYGVAKQNGGQIAVDTYPGRGTSFTIFFPVSVEATEAHAAVQPAIHLRGRGETILLVDDEPGIVALGSEVLSRYGYAVKSARGPEEALGLAWKAPDLIVTDVVMPRIDGPTLVAMLTDRHPNTRAIFMSGYTGSALGVSRPLPEGASLLQKPFTPAQLLESVRTALDLAQRAG